MIKRLKTLYLFLAAAAVCHASVLFIPQDPVIGASVPSVDTATMGITIVNQSASSQSISSIAFSSGASEFSQTNTCGSSIAANSSCVVTVTFAASTTGTRTGTLNVNSGAFTVTVTGYGSQVWYVGGHTSPVTTPKGSVSGGFVVQYPCDALLNIANGDWVFIDGGNMPTPPGSSTPGYVIVPERGQFSDLVMVSASTSGAGSTVVSTASYTFVSGDVGKYVNIGVNPANNGGWQSGSYKINSVASGQATLAANARAPAGNCSGGTCTSNTALWTMSNPNKVSCTIGGNASPLYLVQVQGFNGRPPIAINDPLGTVNGGKALFDINSFYTRWWNTEIFGTGWMSNSSTSSASPIRIEDYGSADIEYNYFHDNLQGLTMTSEYPYGILKLAYNEFDRNGFPAGTQHQWYIGRIQSATIIGNSSRSSILGHDNKSRAYRSFIYGNTFTVEHEGRYAGSGDYLIPTCVHTANGAPATPVGCAYLGAGYVGGATNKYYTTNVPALQVDARGTTGKLSDNPSGGFYFLGGNVLQRGPGSPLAAPGNNGWVGATSNSAVYACSECTTSDSAFSFGNHHPLKAYLTHDISSTDTVVNVDTTAGFPTCTVGSPCNAILTHSAMFATTVKSGQPNTSMQQNNGSAVSLRDGGNMPATPFLLKGLSVVYYVNSMSGNSFPTGAGSVIAAQNKPLGQAQNYLAEVLPEWSEQVTVTGYGSGITCGSLTLQANQVCLGTRGQIGVGNGTAATTHFAQDFLLLRPGDRLEFGMYKTFTGTDGVQTSTGGVNNSIRYSMSAASRTFSSDDNNGWLQLSGGTFTTGGLTASAGWWQITNAGAGTGNPGTGVVWLSQDGFTAQGNNNNVPNCGTGAGGCTGNFYVPFNVATGGTGITWTERYWYPTTPTEAHINYNTFQTSFANFAVPQQNKQVGYLLDFGPAAAAQFINPAFCGGSTFNKLSPVIRFVNNAFYGVPLTIGPWHSGSSPDYSVNPPFQGDGVTSVGDTTSTCFTSPTAPTICPILMDTSTLQMTSTASTVGGLWYDSRRTSQNDSEGDIDTYFFSPLHTTCSGANPCAPITTTSNNFGYFWSSGLYDYHLTPGDTTALNTLHNNAGGGIGVDMTSQTGTFPCGVWSAPSSVIQKDLCGELGVKNGGSWNTYEPVFPQATATRTDISSLAIPDVGAYHYNGSYAPSTTAVTLTPPPSLAWGSISTITASLGSIPATDTPVAFRSSDETYLVRPFSCVIPGVNGPDGSANPSGGGTSCTTFIYMQPQIRIGGTGANCAPGCGNILMANAVAKNITITAFISTGTGSVVINAGGSNGNTGGSQLTGNHVITGRVVHK